MKKLFKKISVFVVCILSAAMCLGSFAACGGEDPVHTDAKAADCTHTGNVEYWTKGGKLYSDEACSTEITEADTVIPALGHDFENGTYVNTDATQHWKVCARTGCNEISTKENHAFTDGNCVCGKAEPKVETPVHHDAVAPDCTTAGNIEYWTKGGKFYSDGACTTEITEADTVRNALGHDFENGTWVNTDDEQHWKVCARTGCDATSTKEDHSYEDGMCDCGKADPTLTTPKHFPAQAPTCGQDGNHEYWFSGGKYYRDEACTDEMTQQETVDPATGDHDTSGAWVNTDADKHYKICPTCEQQIEEADHEFTNGRCVCERTNGFETVEKWDDNSYATREDTATSVKFTIDTNSDDWKVKIVYPISGLAVGDAVAVKYSFTSSVAGQINFETDGDGKNDVFDVAVKEGANELTFYCVVHNAGDVKAVLKVGHLSAGTVLEFSGITYEKLNNNSLDVSSFELKTEAANDKPIEAAKTDHEGWFNITSTKGPDDAWRIKLEHYLNITAGKTYEMVYVIKVNGRDKAENMILEIGDGAGTFATDGQYYWLDANGGDTIIARFRFTANATKENQYSCLQLGNLADQAGNGFNLDFLYINLFEVA